MTEFILRWRGEFANAEVNRLHADAFEHRLLDNDWRALTARHSLGWVTARYRGVLVGFVNVLWDGLVHAWIQDEMVSPDSRRSGVGALLIEIARDEAKSAGCEWLHVDFDDDLRPFYFDAVGFTPTNGGLINLADLDCRAPVAAPGIRSLRAGSGLSPAGGIRGWCRYAS